MGTNVELRNEKNFEKSRDAVLLIPRLTMTHFSQLDGEYFGQEEEIFRPKQSGTKRKLSLGQKKPPISQRNFLIIKICSGCRYITVDFVTAASQNGFCTFQYEKHLLIRK